MFKFDYAIRFRLLVGQVVDSNGVKRKIYNSHMKVSKITNSKVTFNNMDRNML